MTKPNIFFAAISLLLLQSCAKEKPVASGILVANMDTIVKPGDNFHAYVNGLWMKNNKIPADKSSYGVFDFIDDKARENVKTIIETSSKGTFPDGSEEQKVGDYYNAFMDMKTRDAKGIQPLLADISRIDAIMDHNGLANYLGETAAILNVPFAIGVIEDLKDPTRYTLYTWQSGLGLPDREYYLNTDAKSIALRKQYVAHIACLLKLGNVADPDAASAKIMALETKFASAQMKKEDTRDIPKLYNKYALSDFGKLMPSYNWKAHFEKAGIAGQKEIMVAQVDYMKQLDNIIKMTPIDTWKVYLKWHLLHNSTGELTQAIDDENFAFYGKTLSGAQEQEPLWKRGVGSTGGALGEIIGKVYVKKHFTPEAKAKMKNMVENLLAAYRESITNLDWMTPDTRKQALDKLSKIDLKIGYPDKWKEYGDLKIVKGDLYGNSRRSSAFEYKRQLDKLGKKVDKTEWNMTPQTVNAYYNPLRNEIVFPAAILQPPFFDMSVDDAVNYGSIGAIIGHEIGHGFDDQGSGFDGDGVLRDWWTPKDKEAFKQRTAALSAQYSAFQVYPDLNVNGAYTLGENIGDLGGLSIALKAYKKTLNGKEAQTIDGFTGIQRVFIGYAQSWLEKDREEYLRQLVASNPHSPAKFRTNGIVRNIPDFYTAFDVKPGDSLYLAPKDRVRIW